MNDMQLERWLDNISIAAKNQAIRFLLLTDSVADMNDNRRFICKQVEEFNRMYPKGEEYEKRCFD